MPWVRFEPEMPAHRKIRGLSDAAFRLFTTTTCWAVANLTDGHIPTRRDRVAWNLIAAYMGRASVPPKAIDELVAAGLWHERLDGFHIHDFDKYQPLRRDIESERERQRLKAKRLRDTGGSPDGTDRGTTNGTPAGSTGARASKQASEASEASVAPQQADLQQQGIGGSGGKPPAHAEEFALDADALLSVAGSKLQALGVETKVAAKLIALRGPADAIAWASESELRADVRNPAAFVVSMLEKGEKPPTRSRR